MKLLLILVVIASVPGCVHSTSDQKERVITKQELVQSARRYIEREDDRIEFGSAAPAVEHVANSADGKAFWRVDLDITVPAPPGYRIPVGTPTKQRASVYFDITGRPYTLAW